MEWNQWLFQRLWKGLQRWKQKPPDPALEARTARLEMLRPRLTWLARALTGEPIELRPAEAEGGWSGLCFFLPPIYHHAQTLEANTEFYLYRLVYLCLQRRLKLNWSEPAAHSLEDSRRQAAQTSPQVLEMMAREFPLFAELSAQIIAREFAYQQGLPLAEQAGSRFLWGRWFAATEGFPSLSGSPFHSSQNSENSPKTTREAKPREEVRVLTLDQKAMEDYTLNHSFEKIETLEEFQGNWRDLDGADELEAHEEALRELNLRDTIRVETPVHSLYQSEVFGQGGAPELRDQEDSSRYFVAYPEWDPARRRLKANHCRIYPSEFREQNPGYALQVYAQHRLTLQALRQRFAKVYHGWETLDRQSVGTEPDLEAIVQNFAEVRAGHPPSEKVYLSQRRRQRSLALLILMDLSLSTDSYTGGVRILDVEKHAVLLVGQVLHEYGDSFQLDGFSSRTRHYCDYLTLKSFRDSWPVAQRRIGALQPRGYTRIGPALRHATALLKQQSAARKWIILLSDGKPNDYDRYEGHYGLQDVRQAIREAVQSSVQVFGLAIETQAKYYLPLMLREGHYRILPHPAELPQTLAQLCLRLRS